MKQAALKLAQRGLAVFPLKPRDKIPICKHGCRDATVDLETVTGWWNAVPDANIGIATGPQSKVFVVDVDGADGEASLNAIEQKYQAKLPPTWVATTGKGRHLYFRWPVFDGAPIIKNSARQLGAGLDIRGEGGYVVAPPSIHPSGRRYAWDFDSGPEFAEAPVWFLADLTLPRVSDLDARRPPEYWRRLVLNGATEGQRNDRTASLTGYLLRLGLAEEFGKETVAQIVLGWNDRHNKPPLSDFEVLAVVSSICDRYERRAVR